jgi:hypothetical protein
LAAGLPLRLLRNRSLGGGAGTYLALVPGMIGTGGGQGLVWTAMFTTVSTGVAPAEQGVANGLATTAFNLGEAIGLAVLVVIAGTAGTQAAVTFHRFPSRRRRRLTGSHSAARAASVRSRREGF